MIWLWALGESFVIAIEIEMKCDACEEWLDGVELAVGIASLVQWADREIKNEPSHCSLWEEDSMNQL